jgi:cyclic 2,3-diphosphoglycerate synthetase
VLADANFGAPAVQRAIDFLTVNKGYNVVAAAVIGPTPEDFALNVPVVFGADVKGILKEVAAEYEPRTFVDVTEADIGRKLERAIIAARLGIEIRGADYVISPPPVKKPSESASVNIVGTGEVGKTAVSFSLIEIASRACKPGHASMQLGLPAHPEVITKLPLSADDILSAYVGGRAVGGDHYTIAAATGVPACGCSFAGTGLSGVPVSSVVADGVLLLEDAGAELVFVEGSGSSVSPVEPDGWLAVVNRATDENELRGYAEAFSLSSADLVVITSGKKGRKKYTSAKKLTEAVRSFSSDVPIEYGRIVPHALGKVKVPQVYLVTERTGEEAQEWARLLEAKAGLEVVKLYGSETFERENVSFGEKAVLLELGVADLGACLKKCMENGADVAFVAERFEPAKKKSFNAAVVRLVKNALARRNSRR